MFFLRPSFQESLTSFMTPPILYKYCTPSGIDILRNSRLKITPPNQFNDPFELAPRMQEELTREQALEVLTEPRILNATYQHLVKCNQFVGTISNFLAMLRHYSERAIQDLIKSYPASATEFRENHVNNISAEFGLLCLSEVEKDILMWSHYTKSHTGFVLGFHTSDAFFANPPLQQVVYAEERVLVTHSVRQNDPQRAKTVNSLIRRKSVHWKYEKEWRQLHFLGQCAKERDEKAGRFHHYKSFDPTLIAKVIIGCRSTNEPEIRELLSDTKFERVEVVKYQMHDSEFALVPSNAG